MHSLLSHTIDYGMKQDVGQKSTITTQNVKNQNISRGQNTVFKIRQVSIQCVKLLIVENLNRLFI